MCAWLSEAVSLSCNLPILDIYGKDIQRFKNVRLVERRSKVKVPCRLGHFSVVDKMVDNKLKVDQMFQHRMFMLVSVP